MDQITVVITYRAPRIDQLTSGWKHNRDIAKAYNNTALTFRSFLFKNVAGIVFALDALHAAALIAQDFGLQVVILDTSGVQLMRYDINNIVACEILGAPCNRQNMSLDLGAKASAPIKVNVREDDKNLNDLTIDEKMTIGLILQKLDCNSARVIFDHPKIHILYPYLLNHTLHSCSANHTYYTHEEALRDIQSAVTPFRQS